MKLSFIIPAYNEEFYLSKCLDSILNELHRAQINAEVIVVNNASTDQTVEVARRYSAVRVIDEARRGANRARQTGFEASTGDFIVNLDADTMITSKWIQTVFREFERNQKLVALSGPYFLYDLPFHLRFLASFFYRLIYPIYLINNRILRRGASVMGGNLVIRRSALEAIGGYNTGLTFYGDDTDTATRLSKIGTVKFSYRFTVFSSGRRIAAEGIIRTGIRYVMNYLWIALFKRPFTKKETAVRMKA